MFLFNFHLVSTKQYVGTLCIESEKFLLSDKTFGFLVPMAYATEAKGGDAHDLQWLRISSFVMGGKARKNT